MGNATNANPMNPCIRYHLNHTIDYISNSSNIDPSIHYLGNKVSTNECKSSCIDFNYLCDTSSNNVPIVSDAEYFQFNKSECSITASVPKTNDNSSALFLTSNLTANEYIIELQLSITNQQEAGIIFKAKKQYHNVNDYYGYYFGANAQDSATYTGYYIGTDDVQLSRDDITIATNTKYNISVHVNNTRFITYWNGEQIYTSSHQEINESLWRQSYAGIYLFKSDVIFHSFKLTFPNPIDSQDEPFCSAFMFNKDSGDCYGYYGDDYEVIEASVSADTQNKYDSAILYDAATCAPTDSPLSTTEQTQSQEPISTFNTITISTINPSTIALTNPSQIPFTNPSKEPSLNPTSNINRALYSTIFTSELYPITSSMITSVNGSMSSNEEDIGTKPIKSGNDVPVFIIVSSVLSVIFVLIIILIGRLCCRKKGKQKQQEETTENMQRMQSVSMGILQLDSDETKKSNNSNTVSVTVRENDDDDGRPEGANNDNVIVYNMNASGDEIVIGNDEVTSGGDANTIGRDTNDANIRDDEFIIT